MTLEALKMRHDVGDLSADLPWIGEDDRLGEAAAEQVEPLVGDIGAQAAR